MSHCMQEVVKISSAAGWESRTIPVYHMSRHAGILRIVKAGEISLRPKQALEQDQG